MFALRRGLNNLIYVIWEHSIDNAESMPRAWKLYLPSVVDANTIKTLFNAKT